MNFHTNATRSSDIGVAIDTDMIMETSMELI